MIYKIAVSGIFFCTSVSFVIVSIKWAQVDMVLSVLVVITAFLNFLYGLIGTWRN